MTALTLEDLPTSLLIKIFALLDTPDLHNLSQATPRLETLSQQAKTRRIRNSFDAYLKRHPNFLKTVERYAVYSILDQSDGSLGEEPELSNFAQVLSPNSSSSSSPVHIENQKLTGEALGMSREDFARLKGLLYDTKSNLELKMQGLMFGPSGTFYSIGKEEFEKSRRPRNPKISRFFQDQTIENEIINYLILKSYNKLEDGKKHYIFLGRCGSVFAIVTARSDSAMLFMRQFLMNGMALVEGIAQ